MAHQFAEIGDGAAQAFTHREIEVLDLASQGLTNSEIANRLELSVHAIKFHLAAVYRKLGVANRTEAAVAYALGQNRNGHTPNAF